MSITKAWVDGGVDSVAATSVAAAAAAFNSIKALLCWLAGLPLVYVYPK